MGTTEALPGFFEKRALLFAERTDVVALRIQVAAALEAGLFESALEFAIKAGDTAGIEQVREAARRFGDAFSFEAALRALGQTAPQADWVTVGETALTAGRLWFAYRAFEKAENQDGLERTRREMTVAGIAPGPGR